MIAMDTTVALLSGSRLTLGGLLHRLHVQGRLGPLAREGLARQYVLDQARAAGLSVTVEELQRAANIYRRRCGLNTAAETQTWFKERGLTVDDFEAGMEETLLADKLRKHLTAAKVEDYFAKHRAGYEQLRIAMLLVGREELGREVASQVREEGRDLDAVALEQGLPVVRRPLLRKELDGPLAQALAGAKNEELVGPVATPQGFALALIKERRAAQLDATTRQRIEHELFTDWLNAQMQQASLKLGEVGSLR
jgi:hypothetical protein